MINQLNLKLILSVTVVTLILVILLPVLASAQSRSAGQIREKILVEIESQNGYEEIYTFKSINTSNLINNGSKTITMVGPINDNKATLLRWVSQQIKEPANYGSVNIKILNSTSEIFPQILRDYDFSSCKIASYRVDTSDQLTEEITLECGTLNKMVPDDSMPRNSINTHQEIQRTLILEGVPERVYAGDTITFEGRLVRADTVEGIAKALVIMKNENALISPNIIAAGITDDNGRFSIQWIVEAKEKETYGVYAHYMGSAEYPESRSEKYTIEVNRIDLIVQADKEVYTNGDQLVISGSGKPHDVLSVIIVTDSNSIVLGTKITLDGTGKFNTNLLTWDSSYKPGTYSVYVRSITDMPSYEKLVVVLE